VSRPPRRRLLSGDERDRYDHVGSGLLERVRLVRVPILPRAADGMTLGRWVLLRGDRIEREASTLIAHELVHVRQFAEIGLFRFLGRYLAEYVAGLYRHRSHRAAYENISFEIEARREAERWRIDHPGGQL
jgi:hypothetical protein